MAARLSLAQQAGRAGTFDWLLREGRVIWSPESEDLYGIPRGSFAGTFAAWAARVAPDDAERVKQLVCHCLDARQGRLDFEFRAVTPTGLRWFAGAGRFFYGDDGTPQRMIEINIDVHDRRTAEDRHRFLDDLGQATRSVGDPVAVMTERLACSANTSS